MESKANRVEYLSGRPLIFIIATFCRVQPKSLDNLVAPPKTSINSDDVVIVIISDYTMSSCKSSANMLDHSNCP